MVRRVGCARRVFHKEGFARHGLIHAVQVIDGVTANKPVKVFETQARGPFIKRAGLTCGKCGGVMVFAEPGGRVAVVQQDPPDRGFVFRNDAVVAGNPVACSEITPNPA